MITEQITLKEIPETSTFFYSYQIANLAFITDGKKG